MGMMVWYIAEKTGEVIPEISAELLEEKEKVNIKMLEYLAGEPEAEFFETVETIMSKYRQAELLRYIIDKLMEEPQKGVAIHEDNMGIIVMYLKTIIDCIDSEA